MKTILKEVIQNRYWLRRSQKIALKILMQDALNNDEFYLNKHLDLDDSFIEKIQSGKMNLDINTINKIENLLNINLL
jgi:hypothetical protein